MEYVAQKPVTLMTSKEAARPVQMNLGAKAASADLLYFVHADVKLPDSFFDDIIKAAQDHWIGGYRYIFESNNPLLKINGYFSRFPMMWCRGGDQTMFIRRGFFEELGGFDEYFCVMEDFDLIRRASEQRKYHILPGSVHVSARKYDRNPYLKVQWANLRAFRMFRKGVPPPEIRKYYKHALGLKDY